MKKTPSVIIIGGGPAGLIAAETLAQASIDVTIYDRMPSVARKFLMAGHGGLNLTHSEELDSFLPRYGTAMPKLEAAIKSFPPSALRAFSEELGEPTFIGTSGRVFPKSMKAAPLLRPWLARLEKQGVRFVLKHRWLGWNAEKALVFEDSEGQKVTATAKATLLALGGASWPHLGADGKWVDVLTQDQIPVTPLTPANCGFVVPWTEFFADRFAGQPLKPVSLSFGDRTIQGEIMLTREGIEGGPVYALSGALRETLAKENAATLLIDMRPSLTLEELTQRLHQPRGSQSLSTFLRKAGGLSPQAIGLVREVSRAKGLALDTPEQMATLIKALPVALSATASINRAISSAGGLSLDAIDERYMIKSRPGVFAAGEMLDWDAPTGGYLMQACFSTGVAAAKGMIEWLNL